MQCSRLRLSITAGILLRESEISTHIIAIQNLSQLRIHGYVMLCPCVRHVYHCYARANIIQSFPSKSSPVDPLYNPAGQATQEEAPAGAGWRTLSIEA